MNKPPTHLRCEYVENPIGIDARQPRFSWWLNDDRRGAKQTAYQLVVSSGDSTLWDPRRVASDQSTHIVYDGLPLKSRQRCIWRVKTWDMDGVESPWSETATFEMGLLDRADWKGKWIGSPIVGGPRTMAPSPHLRKSFSLTKSVASARLYATALGLYECELNGRLVGDAHFTPGRTEYTKRVPYHTYDVTSLLQDGQNAMGAILGDGWYCGFLHSDPRQTFGDRPRLLAQLVIEFTDGSTHTIATDGSWKTTADGPIRSSDLLMGEDYDARMEIPGWSTSAFDDTSWQAVKLFDDPGIELVAARAPTIRRMEEIKPIAPPSNAANRRRYIFDLGQNMVGRVRLKVSGPAGTTVSIRHAEMLDSNGRPYVQALRSARATDYYTLKGVGEEIYEPRFTFHGFRYVELHGFPAEPTVDAVTGIVLHSGTKPTGTFECSDPMINKLQSNIVWSQKGNFLDIPTDCPQRDERLGWTGDAQVFIRTASFNMDVANFFTKWLQDVADSQFEDGHIPSVVPHVKSIHHEGGPAWADAAVICPWWVYQSYGDTRIIEQCWPNMTRFMDWMRTSYPDFIRPTPGAKWQGYGDWLSMNAVTPPDLIGTAFFAYDAMLMSKMATAIGKTREAAEYVKLATDVIIAFTKRFVSGETLTVATQTAYVLALHFQLVPIGKQAFDALVRDIEARGMHLSTGFVGTPYLNHVLTKFGRPDVAFALLMQKTFPSWLFPVTHGATTMWERWDGWTPENGFNDAGMNSYNHYAYGAVGEWMYSTIAGIDLNEQRPGYKHIILRPHVGGGLTHAKAMLESMYGPIRSAWRVEGGEFKVDVTMPPNTTATLHLPAADPDKVTESGRAAARAQGVQLVTTQPGGTAVFELGAGNYSFTSRLPAK